MIPPREPDEERFEAHGLACHILRHRVLGHLCGYVGLPAGHPLHGETNPLRIDVEVHGGVTYGRKHTDGLYWVGFDCSHYGDLTPGGVDGGTYRTIEYVRKETRKLARQLADLGSPRE